MTGNRLPPHDDSRAGARPRARLPATRREAPSHPPLAAALMMIGIVVFLIAVSAMSVL